MGAASAGKLGLGQQHIENLLELGTRHSQPLSHPHQYRLFRLINLSVCQRHLQQYLQQHQDKLLAVFYGVGEVSHGGFQREIRLLATIEQGDGFAALPGELSFDLIVSNPPYIPTAEIQNLQPEVRDHDPRVALDGGADGLDFFRAIAVHAPAALRSGGRLMLEIGDGQAEPVAALLAHAGWGECELLPDLNNVLRIVIASPANP